jgi:hypothetical protein
VRIEKVKLIVISVVVINAETVIDAGVILAMKGVM